MARPPLDPRAWILATLVSRRGFLAAWAILLGAPALVFGVLVLAAGAPTDGAATPQISASLASNLAPPDAAREQMARLSIARNPPPPEFPPAQAAPAPPRGRLFGLRADQRERFDAAAGILVGLHEACGARLDPTAGGGPPGQLVQAQAALDASIREGDRVRGLITYHHGLIDLCAGQFAAARAEFDQALGAIDGAGAGLKAATAKDTNRLVQYRIVAHYARGVAEMAADQGGRDAAAADADFQAARKATLDPALLRHSGAFVDLSSAAGDLFDFSSAEIVQAQIALRLAQGDMAGAAEAARPAMQATDAAIQHPSLAVSLALAASAAGDRDVVERLDQALTADMGRDPANSDWVIRRRPILTAFLVAAATAPVKIFGPGDDVWWPGGVDGPAGTDARRVFDEKAREGVARDDLWFPPLGGAAAQDAPILDRFLWIRREMAAADAYRFDQLDVLRRAEEALPASDRNILFRVRRQMLGQIGATLMAQAERVRGQDGAEAAAPLLARLSSFDFPAHVWIPARLARVTGLRPRMIWAIFWSLFAAGLVLFVVHRELWIGYRRAFPHRHHDQRRRAGAGWADIPPAGADKPAQAV
jgi:hypothetical protein